MATKVDLSEAPLSQELDELIIAKLLPNAASHARSPLESTIRVTYIMTKRGLWQSDHFKVRYAVGFLKSLYLIRCEKRSTSIIANRQCFITILLKINRLEVHVACTVRNDF